MLNTFPIEPKIKWQLAKLANNACVPGIVLEALLGWPHTQNQP